MVSGVGLGVVKVSKTSPPVPLSKDGEGVFKPHWWNEVPSGGFKSPRKTKSATRSIGGVSLLNTPSPSRRGGRGEVLQTFANLHAYPGE